MIWPGYLISVAVLLQSIESLFIPAWPWPLTAREFPRALGPLLRSQSTLHTVRIFAAVAAMAFPHWFPVAVLVLTSWLIAWRARGTLNGGSDTMTMQILLAWLVALIAPSLDEICACYVAIQIILSYFVAGLAKFMRKGWWDGEALRKILAQNGFDVPLFLTGAGGFLVVAFEMGFPLAAVRPLPFILAGLVFHFVNAYLLGLNRFFFVWLAGYPALLVLAARLHW